MKKKVKGTFNGIDGNAFMLMVDMSDLIGRQRSDKYFQKLAKDQGLSKEWINNILDEVRIIIISLQFC